MREPKLSRLVWAGLLFIIAGIILMGVGMSFEHTAGFACVGSGLIPLGFVISFICFLVWRKKKKKYLRRLMFEHKRQENAKKAREAKLVAAKKLEADRLEEEKEREMKEAARKRSRIIWTSKAEGMSSLLFEYVELIEKGYSLNIKQIEHLSFAYQYVKRDYEWFKSRKNEVPSIDWGTLQNNVEAVEALFEGMPHYLISDQEDEPENILKSLYKDIASNHEKTGGTAGIVNGTYVGDAVWNGVGRVYHPQSISDLNKYVIGITGYFSPMTKEQIVGRLQMRGINILLKRKSKSTNLWILGKDGTLGKSKLSYIKPTDLIVRENDVDKILGNG